MQGLVCYSDYKYTLRQSLYRRQKLYVTKKLFVLLKAEVYLNRSNESLSTSSNHHNNCDNRKILCEADPGNKMLQFNDVYRTDTVLACIQVEFYFLLFRQLILVYYYNL